MQFNTPKFWNKRGFVALLLLPLSLIYFLLSKLDILLAKLRSTYKSKIPVIVIGNINVGGAGKTPTAIAIGKILKKNNIRFCYLTKGYGRKKDDKIVYITLSSNFFSDEIGDEAKILVKHAPVVISRKKHQGIKYINENFKDKFDFIILDDGLQSKYFYKDISFMVIDSKYLFGNNFLLPAGSMRESLSCACKKFNDSIVIGDDNREKIHNLLKKKYNKNIIQAKIEPIINDKLKKLIDDKTKAIGFSGLARNQKFFDMLLSLGINLAKTVDFPDHYNYQTKDIEDIITLSKKLDAIILTTEKDIVKIDHKYHSDIIVVAIELIFDNEQEILNIIKRLKC